MRPGTGRHGLALQAVSQALGHRLHPLAHRQGRAIRGQGCPPGPQNRTRDVRCTHLKPREGTAKRPVTNRLEARTQHRASHGGVSRVACFSGEHGTARNRRPCLGRRGDSSSSGQLRTQMLRRRWSSVAWIADPRHAHESCILRAPPPGISGIALP